jgi:hypothetical protein
MSKSECRINDEARMTNAEGIAAALKLAQWRRGARPFVIRASSFVIDSSFEFRHSTIH